MYQQSVAPVNVGDELDVKIEAVGAKGDGIAKIQGFVLFVAGTHQGDAVKVRVTKVLKNVGFAEVMGKSVPSETASETAPSEESSPEAAAPEKDPEYEDSENFGED